MHTERWFLKATMFSELAVESIEKERFDFASFAAQQSVEFYLKGILIIRVGAKAYSHSLIVLVDSLESTGIDIPNHVRDCMKLLGEHYLQARYPDARVSEYTLQEAKEAVRCMEVCLDFLRGIHTESERA